VTRTLPQVAKVIRSKNAGPFELTLDIIFKTPGDFRLFRRRRIITARRIAALYGVAEADVLGIVYFEPCDAIKITLRRWVPSGSPGDSDIYGAQQHAPLLGITF